MFYPDACLFSIAAAERTKAAIWRDGTGAQVGRGKAERGRSWRRRDDRRRDGRRSAVRGGVSAPPPRLPFQPLAPGYRCRRTRGPRRKNPPRPQCCRSGILAHGNYCYFAIFPAYRLPDRGTPTFEPERSNRMYPLPHPSRHPNVITKSSRWRAFRTVAKTLSGFSGSSRSEFRDRR